MPTYANNMIQPYFMQDLQKKWEIKLDKEPIIIKNTDLCIAILVLKSKRNSFNKQKEKLENFYCIHFCSFFLCLSYLEEIIDSS